MNLYTIAYFAATFWLFGYLFYQLRPDSHRDFRLLIFMLLASVFWPVTLFYLVVVLIEEKLS